jgi:Domain of unknown function (DUF6950)
MKVKHTTPDQALAVALAEMTGPFDVASRDCCRAAGWAFECLWGVNPVVGADYTSHRGALRFLARFGGVTACHETLAARSGLVACDPLPGVIGSIKTPAGSSPLPWALGLCIRPGEWAVMGAQGMTILQGPARAWGVPWV